MICERTINIDMDHPYSGEVFRFHEGDVNGSTIRLGIFKDSTAFDLSGCTAKYDAVIGSYLAEANASGTISENYVTIPVTGAMTAYPGNLKIDVRIIKNEDILFFQTLRAYVQPRVIDDSIVTPEGEPIADFLTRMSDDVDYAVEEVDKKMNYAAKGSPASDDNKGQAFYTDTTIGVKTSNAASSSEPVTTIEAYSTEASDARYARAGAAVKLAEAWDKDKSLLEPGQLHIDDAVETGTLYLYKNSVGTVIGTLRACGVSVNAYKRIQIRELGGNNPEISSRVIDYSGSTAIIGNWVKFATVNDIPDTYTKTEIDNMIGDIETALAEV